MQGKPKLCERCELSGYSPDVCKVHAKMIADNDHETFFPKVPLKMVGKSAAVGAGCGVAATFALVALPAVAAKAALGLLMAAKISAGGGVIGAGINVAKKAKNNKPPDKPRKKKRMLIF
jgi:hypothetical protein